MKIKKVFLENYFSKIEIQDNNILDYFSRLLNKFFNNKDEYKNIGEILTTDIHSHILPGIDDGAKSLNESIAMIEALVLLGYKKAVLTPHIMNEGYKNDTERILNLFYLLNKQIQAKNIDIVLDVSAEYYLDDNFLFLLSSNDILPLCGNHILFETSYLSLPFNFKEIIYEMRVRGYRPLLAHPERYIYVRDNYSIYEEWRDLGIEFQLELNSFNAKYGKEALKRAVWLSQKGWIDYLGTDAHSIEDILRIKDAKYLYPLSKVISSNDIKNIRYC